MTQTQHVVVCAVYGSRGPLHLVVKVLIGLSVVVKVCGESRRSVGRSGEPSNMETYVAPYVQVRHAIHLLYATSPRSRDGAPEPDDSEAQLSGGDEPPAAGEPDGDAPRSLELPHGAVGARIRAAQ